MSVASSIILSRSNGRIIPRGGFYKRGCQEKTLLPFRMEMEKVGVWHPAPCAALLWSVALRGIPVHQLLRSSCRAGAPASSVAAMCQPWFYRRLEAYGFVGLSEGAYGGP